MERSCHGTQASARSGVIIRPIGLDRQRPSSSSERATLMARSAMVCPMPGGSMSQVLWWTPALTSSTAAGVPFLTPS